MREILTSGEFRKGPDLVLNKGATGVLRSPPIFSDKLKVIVRGWWEGKKREIKIFPISFTQPLFSTAQIKLIWPTICD